MWHLTLATDGRTPLSSDPTRAIALARATIRTLAPWLFSIVDDHAHALAAGDRAAVGKMASGWSRALAALGVPPLAAVRIRPIDDRRHLESLLGYLVRQADHHGIGWSPLGPGSCLPDVVGARRIGFDPTPLAQALPRVDVPRAALVAAGLPAALPSVDLREVGAAQVWAAGLTVIGRAEARGRASDEVALRTAIRHLDLPQDAREHAGVPARTWQRLAHVAPDPALMDAIRRRVALERAVAEAAIRRARSPDRRA